MVDSLWFRSAVCMADNSAGGEIGPISPLWGGVKTVNGAGGLALGERCGLR